MGVVAIGLVCALTGLSKATAGGMGMIVLPILLFYYPLNTAMAILAPIYVVCDLFLLKSTYRKIDWSIVAQMIPLAAIAVSLSGIAIILIEQFLFELILGLTIVILAITTSNGKGSLFGSLVERNYIVSFLSGVMTMMGNTSGPLVNLYLFSRLTSKGSIVATRSLIYLCLNVLKCIIFLRLSILNFETFKLSVFGLPGLFIGATLGLLLLNWLSLSAVANAVRVVCFMIGSQMVISALFDLIASLSL